MSANIYYRVLPCKNRDIDVSAPSSFIEAMRRAFGEHPWILDSDSLGTLRGLAAGYGAGKNPYDDVISKIERVDGEFNTIEVWPEW